MAIIALNVLIYGLMTVTPTGERDAATLALGYIPAVANEIRVLPAELSLLPNSLYLLTSVTSAFIHADLFHLGGNMLFLWVFGDNVEDALGHFKFIIFYLACCFAAAWLHAFTFPTSEGPLIGASGAAAGIVAAYLMLHPRMKIWALFLGRIPFVLPAWILLSAWAAYQMFMYFTDRESQISWAAHVGGILAGALLVVLLKRRDVPLFDKEIKIPEAVELEPWVELPVNVEQKPRQKTWGRDGSLK